MKTNYYITHSNPKKLLALILGICAYTHLDPYDGYHTDLERSIFERKWNCWGYYLQLPVDSVSNFPFSSTKHPYYVDSQNFKEVVPNAIARIIKENIK